MAQPTAVRSFENVTRFLIKATLFIVPLFYLPITPEALELPKQYLLSILVLLTVLSWVAHFVVARSFEFRRTVFDIPLVVLWIVLLLSTLTSRDRLTSLLGNYDNNTWSFLGITVLMIFFFLLTQTIQKHSDAKMYLAVLLASGAVAEIIFMLRVIAPRLIGFLKLNAGNPSAVLSTPFGIFALLSFVICLASLINKRERLLRGDWLWGLAGLLAFATMLMIGFKSLWMLAAIALAIFLVYAVARIDEHRFWVVIVSFVLFIAAILFAFFGVPRWLSAQLPLEVGLSQGVSWQIVSSAVTADVKGFLLGTGPSTFVLDFSKYRPESFNTNFAWNVRFAQPSSTILEFFAATGVLGMIALIAILLLGAGTSLVIWFRKVASAGIVGRLARDEATAEFMPWFWGVVTMWLVLLIASFFHVYTTLLWFLFFISLALLAAMSRLVLREHEATVRFSLKTSPQYTLLVSFGFIIACTAMLVLGIFLTRFLVAETAYARGLTSVVNGQPETAIADFSRAITFHPKRAAYHLSLAQAYLFQGLKAANSGQADPNLITTLVALAVNEAKRTTELSPNNVNGWQGLATMYANARPIAPDANQWVIRSLERAIELEKSNPVLFVQLGNALFFDRNNAEAIKQYQRAIQLKPDYIDAYMNLAMLEEGTGKVDDAINHLSQALLIAPQNSDISFNLGRLYYNRNQSGDLTRAGAAFQIALQANPNHANALYSTGLLEERLGNTSRALEMYRRVQSLDPGNQDVKRKIQALTGAASEPTEAP